jgi:hypothetical protein
MTIAAMLDLETLDTTADAQILTIGGVKFDPDSGAKPYADFYYRLELDSQDAKGRTISEDTMAWWSRQDDKIILEAFGDHNRHSVEEMLVALKKWYVGVDEVWAQGICFDIGMLENLHRQYGYPIPWSFWKVKDSRTIFGLMKKDPRKNFIFDAHNALEDARIQAKCVQLAKAHLTGEINV